MDNLQEYKQQLSDVMKFLIPYGKTKTSSDKTIMVIAYDESDNLDSRTFAFGDPDVLGHLMYSTMVELPEDVLLHMLAHVVDDFEEVLINLIELKETGELPLGDD